MPSNINIQTTYTTGAKLIHGTTALLVFINIAFGLHMEHFPGYKHGQPEWNDLLFYHASLGALVFWLTVVRIVWRAKHRPPQNPASMPGWQKVVSKIVHGALYVSLLALPLTGYIHRLAGKHPVSFWGAFDWPILVDPNEPLRLLMDKIHVGLACVLITLISLHLGAVLKHTFIDRDSILKRMF
jgi:cytochrome b561